MNDNLDVLGKDVLEYLTYCSFIQERINKGYILASSNLLQINACNTEKELKELRKLCKDKPEYIDLIDFKLQLLNIQKKEYEKKEKIKEDIDLVEGEYYYIWLGEDKQLTIPVRESENKGQNIQYEYVPVVAVYDEGKLIDFISRTYFTLNPLKAYRYPFYNVVNLVTRLKRDDLYKETKILYELTEPEKEKYKKEIKDLIVKLKNKDEIIEEEQNESETSQYSFDSTFTRQGSTRILNNKPLHGGGKLI